MGAQTLFIIAGIFFVVGLMLALVVLLWAVGGCKNLKVRIYSAEKSPVASISNGLKDKFSSDETVYVEENGAPGKGSYDLTPIVEMEALSPKSKTSDDNFAEGSVTPTESEVKVEKIGAHLMYLCVTKRTYPQEKPTSSRGAFAFLEDDT